MRLQAWFMAERGCHLRKKKTKKKKSQVTASMRKAKNNPQTLKKVQENQCQLLSHLFWVSRMELVWVPHPEKGEITADQYKRCGCRDELLRHKRKE